MFSQMRRVLEMTANVGCRAHRARKPEIQEHIRSLHILLLHVLECTDLLLMGAITLGDSLASTICRRARERTAISARKRLCSFLLNFIH